MSNHQITVYRRKFEDFDLAILDELGYISFDKSGSELLFNLLFLQITFLHLLMLLVNLMSDFAINNMNQP